MVILLKLGWFLLVSRSSQLLNTGKDFEKACFCRAARVLGNSSIACAFEEVA